MGACMRKRVVYDMSCKRLQFFVNVKALASELESLSHALQFIYPYFQDGCKRMKIK